MDYERRKFCLKGANVRSTGAKVATASIWRARTEGDVQGDKLSIRPFIFAMVFGEFSILIINLEPILPACSSQLKSWLFILPKVIHVEPNSHRRHRHRHHQRIRSNEEPPTLPTVHNVHVSPPQERKMLSIPAGRIRHESFSSQSF